MARKKVSRNAPCPCGSGRKYKKCCWGKGFDWEQDEAGNLFKSVPISPEVADVLQAQRQRFIDKHGREPGPDDPVFFDLPHPEHLEAMMAQDMKAAGIDPALIYAFEKTGRLVTEQNRHLLPDSTLDEWQAAIDEYEAKHRKPSRRPQYPLGSLALYGPDDRTTTKVTAGVVRHEGAEPIIRRWVGTGVMDSAQVRQELREFFTQHGITQVAMTEGNLGCPHEEGEDYPVGEDCPFCPFWKGKQGSNRRD
jgi:hypothetical protein